MLRTFARTMVQQGRMKPWSGSALKKRPTIPAPRGPAALRLYTTQQDLPKLPVAPIQQTLDKFLSTVRPLLNDDEFRHAEKLVGEFESSGGGKLQSLLEERARTTDNWLSEWWLNVAYLEWRLPATIHVSPGLLFPKQEFKSPEEQINYAAKLILGVLDYKSIIDEGRLVTEMMAGQPLDMTQFYKIMSSCRVPAKNRDRIVCYPADQPNAPKHIMVIRNNHFFRLEVYGSNGKPLSAKQLADQLTNIANQGSTAAPPVGILTSQTRDNWAKAHYKLAKDPVNAELIDQVEKSIFVLCLDQSMPKTLDSWSSMACGQINHGGGSKFNTGNRWFDKTLQFMVGSDGHVGLLQEHSLAEAAGAVSGCADHVLNFIQKQQDFPSNDTLTSMPKHLQFNVTPEILQEIESAGQRIDKDVADLEIKTAEVTEVGKEFMKSQRMSPDAFIQVGIQYAFYRLYGHNVATYESGSLRRYKSGRTETIRSCSIASDQYCRAMRDPSVDGQEKARLLREAVIAHRAYTDGVINGAGIDRHLMGLSLIAKENNLPVPALLKDPVYTNSVHWRISTSQVPSKHNVFITFGPVVSDGYGICYNPRPESVNFSVTAWRHNEKTNAGDFAQSLREALIEGRDVLSKHPQAKL